MEKKNYGGYLVEMSMSSGKGRLWDDDPTDTEAFEEEKRKAVKGFQQSILYLHSLFNNERDGQRDWHGLHIPCSDYLYLHT
jgi:hypothetical protein